jgi:NAD(P)-dependent dehydrogenase (short-subunit alcohol dehydrogenase family)
VAGSPLALEGRVALITGVGRRAGIGYAIARRLLGLGAAVVAQAWTPYDVAAWNADPAEADAVLSELKELGDVEQVQADFAKPDSPADLMEAAKARFGHVDVLVVNHTRSGDGTLAELTAGHLDDFLHENVRASLLLVKEFAAQHDGRPGGRVVMMTSGQHISPMASEIAYAVSKGALHQATLTLSESLIDRGITVNAINPGPTDTGWGLSETDPRTSMPQGRWGEPDDAARLIAWLCTDDAQWITGQVFDSEGGFRRWRSDGRRGARGSTVVAAHTSCGEITAATPRGTPSAPPAPSGRRRRPVSTSPRARSRRTSPPPRSPHRRPRSRSLGYRP